MRFVTYFIAGSGLVAGTILELSHLTLNTLHLAWLGGIASLAALLYLALSGWKNKLPLRSLRSKQLMGQLLQFWLEAVIAGFVVVVLREMRLQSIDFPVVMLAVPVAFAFWLTQLDDRHKQRHAATATKHGLY